MSESISHEQFVVIQMASKEYFCRYKEHFRAARLMKILFYVVAAITAAGAVLYGDAYFVPCFSALALVAVADIVIFVTRMLQWRKISPQIIDELGLKCPVCGHQLGEIPSQQLVSFKSCPHCGAKIEES